MMDEVPARVVDACYALRLEAKELFRECGREIAATLPKDLEEADVGPAVVTASDEHPILDAVSDYAAIVHAASESVCEDHALRSTPYGEDWMRLDDDHLHVSPHTLASCILEHYVWEARAQPGTSSPPVRAAKAQSICNRVAQADQDEDSRVDGLTPAGRQDLHRLRRENRRLREELEILAKATAWFARDYSRAAPVQTHP